MSSASNNSSHRLRSIAFWILKGLLALSFVGAGTMKLLGLPLMVHEFDTVGLGQWFRYFTAACELIGAILLIVPRTVAAGALLLGVVCIGAFFAQLLALHGDWIHTVIFAAILLAIAWAKRDQIVSSGQLRKESEA